MGNKYLPYGGFKRLKNVDEFDVMSVGEKSPIGYFLEVDLQYPHELHELCNDYPLAPEKLAVPRLSNYCKKIADKQVKVGDVNKLIANFGNKIIYVEKSSAVFVFRNESDFIHRVLKFKQFDWMKKY